MSCKIFCVFVLLGSVIYVQGRYYNLTTSDRYAVVGSPFTFTCRGDPVPLINWFENNTRYIMEVLGRYGPCISHSEHPEEYTFNCSNGIHTLTIKSVKLSQHGTVWRCGDFNPGSNEIKLEVRGGPAESLHLTSLLTKSVLSVAEGSDVTLICSAKCFLTCDYEWQVRGHVISNSSVLSLADINRTQNGLYTCTATNPDTKETSNQTVKINIEDLRDPDKNNSHFAEGFATGFAVVVFILVGAALFLFFWFRKRKRKQKEENIYYNPGQDNANEAPPGDETEENANTYSSLGVRENVEPYDVLKFENQSQNASEAI